MNKRILLILIAFLALFGVGVLQAQNYKVHSHNDYAQELPFWYAYSNGATSIEADIFLKDNELYVTHSKDEIVTGHTLQKLYLDSLKSLFQSGELRELQLLIDIKSGAHITLEKLVEVLKGYPKLLESGKVQFVISGNRPKPEEYKNYPDFIWFDHQNLDELSTISLEKVALVSVNYKNYSVWNGYGRMTAPDLKKVKTAIVMVKNVGKPFRFWGTPDTKTAWARLAKLGVDYINTDEPALAKQYLDKLHENTFKKESPVTVYRPKYEYDTNVKPKNVVLMIGDGNGLAQISAAMIANRGELTLAGIKNIGLVKTASHDDLITDSAAGATAMATGTKTDNRAIGVNSKGEALANLVDISSANGFNTAIVTTDAIYGATPASFFAHRVERDDTDGLVEDLKQSKLNFFISGGQNEENSIKDAFATQNIESFDSFQQPTAIYLGDNKVPSIQNGRKDAFPTAVKKALDVLNKKEQPFFLMVESAQIDNGGHSNRTCDIVEEMLDFDQAIAEVLRFSDANQNTLVIITADHETSGFGIVGGNLSQGVVQGDFLTVDHTGIMVPLFAYGPQSDKFTGIFDNTEIFHKLLKVLIF